MKMLVSTKNSMIEAFVDLPRYAFVLSSFSIPSQSICPLFCYFLLPLTFLRVDVSVPSIIKLTASEQAGPDVRLAAAEILSSLSIAPHTRAAIIDNNGLDYLVQLLANYSAVDISWNGQGSTTLAVGNALLQLSSGAMANSNKWIRSPDGGHNHSERAGVIQ